MYKNMSQILSEGKVGSALLSKFEISSSDFYAKIQGIPSGNYVRLLVNGELVMSDTNMEKRTNSTFCLKAHGDVLIGGLGIGLILLEVQDKPNVRSITIVEKSKDVIDLVGVQLPLKNNVRIINADVFTYKPDMKYNTIYMDIWPSINSDIYENEMKPLIARYRRYLVDKSVDPDRYLDCWAKYQAKNDRRLY